MDYSEHNENKRKVYKYTDEFGHVIYVDENGNPLKRRRSPSSEQNSPQKRSSERPHQNRSSHSEHSSEKRPSERTRSNHSAPADRRTSGSSSSGNNSARSSHGSSSKGNSSSSPKKNNGKKKKRGFLKGFFIFISILILAAIGIFIGAYITIIKGAPELNTSDIVPSNFTSIIYDDNGEEIDKLHGEENREYVTIDQIPQDLQNAVVSIEDERYYDHNGIDIKGIMRALAIDIKERDFSQGASTITQQLIKNEVLERKKTIVRKIQEQYLAVKYEAELEKTLGSKEAAKKYILELYLNTIGLNHGLNGVGAASQYYFGKEVSELDLAECACIAGITKYPSKYSPIVNQEANKERQTLVLDKMLELEYITQDQYDQAIAEDIYSNLVGKTSSDDDAVALHSYFVDNLIVTLASDLMEQKNMTKQEAYNLIYSGGLQIYSTVNQDIQNTLEDAFMDDSLFPPSDTTYDATYTISVLNTDTNEQEHHSESKQVNNKDEADSFAEEIKAKYVDNTHTLVLDNLTVSNSLQAAMVILDYKTGDIKGLIGGRGEKPGDLVFNRATQAYRQPGSCFKILASYAPAIDQNLCSAGTFIKDDAYTVGGWTPGNWWGSKYRGYATVREGIRDSMNILAAKTIVDAGVYNAYNYLLNFGFTSLQDGDINANISLGGLTEGVSVLELTAAYGTIANDGIYMKPTPYTKVLDHDGNVLLEYDFEGKRVIKDTTAFLLTDMMEDVVSGGGTGGLARFKRNSMPVAGKTGTTTEDKDLTFAGYTPYYVSGIWMGYDTPKKIKYDKSYHLIVWRTVMDKLHDNLAYKNFEKPNGIMSASYCAIENSIPIPGVCENDYYGAGYYGNMVSSDYCVSATAPKKECTVHKMYKICTETGYLAGPDLPDDVVEEVCLAVVDGEIINRPSKEECEKEGKLYIDISKTTDFLPDHPFEDGIDNIIGSNDDSDTTNESGQSSSSQNSSSQNSSGQSSSGQSSSGQSSSSQNSSSTKPQNQSSTSSSDDNEDDGFQIIGSR